MTRLIAVLTVLTLWGCTMAPEPVIGPPLQIADTALEATTLAEDAPSELEIVFFDVGRGDATLVKCPDGRRILIDAGSLGGLTSAQKSAVRQKIRSHIGDRLDLLVVTHPDADHYNLLARTLQSVKVSHVFYGGERDRYTNGNFKNWLRAFENKGQATSPPERFHDPEAEPNSSLSCAGVSIWIVAANVPADTGAKSNFVKNTPSIVLRLEHRDVDVILGADATTMTEDDILGWYSPGFLDVEVLKLGHHGSRTTSTGWDWAETTKPRLAIASTSGGRNPHGHPNAEVILRVARYTDDLTESHKLHWCAGQDACGTAIEVREAIYSTSSAGSIVLRSDGETWTVSCDHSDSC